MTINLTMLDTSCDSAAEHRERSQAVIRCQTNSGADQEDFTIRDD
jgi:hypothetical protein